jgi:8-oxo-dGTP diphosphatase
MAYIPASKEEEEFLKNYDPSKYKKPAVSADGAIFAWDRANAKLRVLLIKRGNFPYKDTFALPGGFAEVDEDISVTITREMQEETHIENIVFEQVRAFGTPGRDPRDRVITILYAAVVGPDAVHPVAGDDAAEAEWYDITEYKTETIYQNGACTETVSMVLQGSRVFTPKIIISPLAQTVEIADRGGLAFDHAHEVIAAYRYIQNRL